MLYVPRNADLAPMSNLWHETIGKYVRFLTFFVTLKFTVSITPGMAGIGSLLAGQASDKYGRRKVDTLFRNSIYIYHFVYFSDDHPVNGDFHAGRCHLCRRHQQVDSAARPSAAGHRYWFVCCKKKII
jgi:hypothetical protein